MPNHNESYDIFTEHAFYLLNFFSTALLQSLLQNIHEGRIHLRGIIWMDSEICVRENGWQCIIIVKYGDVHGNATEGIVG